MPNDNALCSFELLDDGAIAIVTLNDPATTNAMSPEMGDQFVAVVAELKDQPDLRAVIVRGAGTDFSIGGHRDMLSHLADERQTSAERSEFMIGYYNRWLSVLDVPVPVIAAFEGDCIGVAPVFALVSDIALADETTHFEITFANLGLYPGMGVAKLLPDAIGRQRSALALIGAIPFSGAEAASMGFVARSVPVGGVHDAALALARRIAAAAPETVRKITKTLRVKRSDLDAQLASDSIAQAESYASGEFRDRIARYLPEHYAA